MQLKLFGVHHPMNSPRAQKALQWPAEMFAYHNPDGQVRSQDGRQVSGRFREQLAWHN